MCIYLDNILIFSKILPEHWNIVWKVLALLQEHQVYLQPKKCEFKQMTIDYLGLIISEGKVEMDPVKVKGVTDWPTPKP